MRPRHAGHWSTVNPNVRRISSAHLTYRHLLPEGGGLAALLNAGGVGAFSGGGGTEAALADGSAGAGGMIACGVGWLCRPRSMARVWEPCYDAGLRTGGPFRPALVLPSMVLSSPASRNETQRTYSRATVGKDEVEIPDAGCSPAGRSNRGVRVAAACASHRNGAHERTRCRVVEPQFDRTRGGIFARHLQTDTGNAPAKVHLLELNPVASGQAADRGTVHRAIVDQRRTMKVVVALGAGRAGKIPRGE